MKKEKVKERSKKIPIFIWVIFGVLAFAGMGYATTIISEDSVNLTNGNLNIVARNNELSLANFRTNNSERDGRIVFWDDPSSTLSTSRIGMINWHGLNTSVGTDELAVYMTNESGFMQNQFKLVGQQNYTGNNYIILTGSQGIARTSGLQINIGANVLGGGTSETAFHNNVKMRDNNITNISFIDGGSEVVMSNDDFASRNLSTDTLIRLSASGNTQAYLHTGKADSSDTARTLLFGIRPSRSTGEVFRLNSTTRALQINSASIFQLNSNSTALACNTGNAGAIYYDNNLFKHFGCNSTTWNALY